MTQFFTQKTEVSFYVQNRKPLLPEQNWFYMILEVNGTPSVVIAVTRMDHVQYLLNLD